MASACDSSKTTLIDLFAGAGGNVIAFALSGRWRKVIAIEKDPATLTCAQHNAAVYEVFDQITWVLGDSFKYLEQLKNSPSTLEAELQTSLESTVLFASPPWGGVGYRDHEIFDLATMRPYNLVEIHDACKPMEHALYLPRTSDLRQIAKLAPKGKKIEVIQYCMEGASKAMVAYVPENHY
jgi:trimethylguanosine synthase